MEDSNELLQGLYYVRNLLEAMQKQNAEQQQLENEVRPPLQLSQRKQSVPYRGKRVAIIIFLVLFGLNMLVNVPSTYSDDQQQIKNKMSEDEYYWTLSHRSAGDHEPYPGYDGPTKPNFIFSLLKAALYSLPFATVISLVIGGILHMSDKSKNMRIEQNNKEIDNWNERVVVQNQEIAQHNEAVKEEIQKICSKKMMISEEYQKNTVSWFPKDYGFPSAVDYFINKVENHMASSIVEAVKQYEEDQFRNRQLEELRGIKQGQVAMVKRQDDMIKQQMIGNLIGIANFMQLGQVANAANQRNIHLGEIANATNRMANKF